MHPGTYMHSESNSGAKMIEQFPPGVGTPPLHNGKINYYQVPARGWNPATPKCKKVPALPGCTCRSEERRY